MKTARDLKGKALHKNDEVFYLGKVWKIDRVAGTRLYLSFFGASATVEAKDVTKNK